MSPFSARPAASPSRAQTTASGLPAFACAGGDNRVRTDDPLLAKQVLSQLSYTPVVFRFGSFFSLQGPLANLKN